MNFLKQEYGDDLKSVVLHLDETYPHLHFFAVSEKVSNCRILHCGYKAQDEMKQQGQNKKYLLNETYTNAMTKLQDRYFNSVSNKLGLTRISKNPQQRVDRKTFIDTSRNNRSEARNKSNNL